MFKVFVRFMWGEWLQLVYLLHLSRATCILSMDIVIKEINPMWPFREIMNYDNYVYHPSLSLREYQTKFVQLLLKG